MANPATKVSISSVLQRAGKSVSTVLSAVDILDDGIAIASNYMAKLKEEQLKASQQEASEFDNQLKVRQAQAEINFKANAYQIGAKARQLQSLPEYEENLSVFNELIK